MAKYKSRFIGSGSDDDPYLPAAALHVSVWTGQDLRPAEDAMIVTCEPIPEEHLALLADERIEVVE